MKTVAEPDDLRKVAREIARKILEQREEILRAFIAKYGCDPDEIEQVESITPQGHTWYVRRIPKQKWRTLNENCSDRL